MVLIIEERFLILSAEIEIVSEEIVFVAMVWLGTTQAVRVLIHKKQIIRLDFMYSPI